MTLDTQPMTYGGRDRTPETDFRVDTPFEVRQLLTRLHDEQVLLHLHAPNGAHLTTSLWALDTAREAIELNADANDTNLCRLLEAEEITAVGYLDSVKLQFELMGTLLVRGVQGCSLSAALPRELYRFQRRSAFRVRPAERAAPTAFLPHPMIPDMQLALRLLDVSATGCALFMPDDVPPLQPGVRINAVRVQLDGTTTVMAGLKLHHVTSINPDSRGTRLGCEWSGLSGDAARGLQQFIDRSQRRRRVLPND